MSTRAVRKPAMAPPKLPIVFMQPATMAAYLRPMSWHVDQAEPIVRSLKKAAKEIAKKNENAVGVKKQANMHRAHSPCPNSPMIRRPNRRLPVRRMNQSVKNPPPRQPAAPSKSGPPL